MFKTGLKQTNKTTEFCSPDVKYVKSREIKFTAVEFKNYTVTLLNKSLNCNLCPS